jgi:hypothetical protein
MLALLALIEVCLCPLQVLMMLWWSETTELAQDWKG